MKRLVLAALALAWAGNVHAAPCRLADLGWMAGTWRYDTADTQTEERWAPAPGGQLMGSSWSLHPAHPGGVIEAETIQDAGGVVALKLRHFDPSLDRSWEAAGPPMVFTASDCGAGVATFDGQADHAGEHITYRRVGNTLTFTGAFIHQGQPVQVVIPFTRRGG